jgi:hypothetical protein
VEELDGRVQAVGEAGTRRGGGRRREGSEAGASAWLVVEISPKPSSPSWLVELMYGRNHPGLISRWSKLWG